MDDGVTDADDDDGDCGVAERVVVMETASMAGGRVRVGVTDPREDVESDGVDDCVTDGLWYRVAVGDDVPEKLGNKYGDDDELIDWDVAGDVL